jgi:hypothetical protein
MQCTFLDVLFIILICASSIFRLERIHEDDCMRTQISGTDGKCDFNMLGNLDCTQVRERGVHGEILERSVAYRSRYDF